MHQPPGIRRPTPDIRELATADVLRAAWPVVQQLRPYSWTPLHSSNSHCARRARAIA